MPARRILPTIRCRSSTSTTTRRPAVTGSGSNGPPSGNQNHFVNQRISRSIIGVFARVVIFVFCASPVLVADVKQLQGKSPAGDAGVKYYPTIAEVLRHESPINGIDPKRYG